MTCSLVLAGLVLASCQQTIRDGDASKPGPSTEASAQTTEAPVREPVAEAPPPSARNQTKRDPAREDPPTKVAAVPKPPKRSQPPPLAINRLVGMDQTEAGQRVGRPTSVIEQPPSIVWRYDAADCRLSLHFYLEVKRKSYLVLRTEVEGRKGARTTEQNCLDRVRGRI